MLSISSTFPPKNNQKGGIAALNFMCAEHFIHLFNQKRAKRWNHQLVSTLVSKVFSFHNYLLVKNKKPRSIRGFKAVFPTFYIKVVPTAGVEPARSCPRWILNPLRLPIPPRWHADKMGKSIYRLYHFFSLYAIAESAFSRHSHL